MHTTPYLQEIDTLYRRILDRPVDPSGYATYSALLGAGKVTLAELARILRESDEYRTRLPHYGRHYRFAPDALPEILCREAEPHRTAGAGAHSGVVAATIVAANRISLARVTAASFREHHPDLPFITLLADANRGRIRPADEPFRLLALEDVGIPALERFRFHYTREEASYAATPFLLQHLLDAGFSAVLFLKQETMVVADLEPILESLRGASLVLTPHLLDPDFRGRTVQRELDVLRAGIFNGGVIGIADSDESRRFLRWWQQRTWRDCQLEVADGLHYEQRWLDFAPSLLRNLRVLRDPGVNIGHWNLAERQVREEAGRLTARGRPCRIFRFSGYQPERPDRVTRYSPDFAVAQTGAAAAAFARYQAMLEAADWHRTSNWSYAFDRFGNGVAIADIVRRIYHDMGAAVVRFGDPLSCSGPTPVFYDWLRQDSGTAAGVPVTNLCRQVYEYMPDARHRFPFLHSDAREFSQWCVEMLGRDLGVAPELAVGEAWAG